MIACWRRRSHAITEPTPGGLFGEVDIVNRPPSSSTNYADRRLEASLEQRCDQHSSVHGTSSASSVVQSSTAAHPRRSEWTIISVDQQSIGQNACDDINYSTLAMYYSSEFGTGRIASLYDDNNC